MTIHELGRRPAVRRALDSYHQRLESFLDSIIEIQQIPAPTFEEAARAAYMEGRFRALGLSDVEQDDLHNVYGLIRGGSSERRPLVVSAHLDTVFPAGTDLTVHRNGDYLYGPGIGDNCTGLAGLLALAETLCGGGLGSVGDVWLAANVGEEGLGDLRGMRAVVDRFGPQARYLVVEGGLYGQLSHQAVGVRRFRVDITGAGGHSWGNFGTASAVHVMGHLIAAIDRLDVPATPKTTFNVGIVEGGLSINSIASSASFWLDLRSEGRGQLADLVRQVEAIVRRTNQDHASRGNGIEVRMSAVGQRPAGEIPRSTPIVASAGDALRFMGCSEVRYIAGSTDANIPLSRGYEAVCLGLTESGNAHRTDEYIDISRLPYGLGQLLLVTLAVAGA
jgi:acetylornithine deacetylase/succinyl-diaminopimelate desuccinylase-like protein